MHAHTTKSMVCCSIKNPLWPMTFNVIHIVFVFVHLFVWYTIQRLPLYQQQNIFVGLQIFTCIIRHHVTHIKQEKTKTKKNPVLRANRFQKVVGQSGIFFLHILPKLPQKSWFFCCLLCSRLFIKIEQMGKKQSVGPVEHFFSLSWPNGLIIF